MTYFLVINISLLKMNDDILINYVICKQRLLLLQELLNEYRKTTTLGDALADTVANMKVLKRIMKEKYEIN